MVIFPTNLSNIRKMEQNFPEILYEDNHLIAVNKKAGDIVQGDKTGDQPLSEKVKEYIRRKYNKTGEAYLGLPHRIDRPVSGVVLFAKTGKALSRINKMFHDKEVQKTYWAIVKNKPNKDEDVITHYLKKNNIKNKSSAYSSPYKDTKKAELRYRILYKLENYYLLEINPYTGRHHQIRVQLSSMGCPIKGDVKYGFDRTNPDASIHLHARKIDFVHPVQKVPMSIVAPPPNEVLWNAALKMI